MYARLERRLRLADKNSRFPVQTVDEIALRRQKSKNFSSNCRRDWTSPTKKQDFRVKLSTRLGFVDKNSRFPGQTVDEKKSRRQKSKISGSNCRREKVSSTKTSIFTQNIDELASTSLLIVDLPLIQLPPEINIFASNDFSLAFSFNTQIFQMR